MIATKNWRYEYKMVIKNLTLDEAKTQILLHPKSFIERYPMRKVNNAYFDTYNLSNYHDALSGCNRRSKLRFRWYGESVSQAKGSLELKEKKGMLITKASQEIDKPIDFSRLDWDEIRFTIQENLTDLLKVEFFYASEPMIINSYYRYYYETLDSSCRITLDYNQRVYDQRVYPNPNLHFQNPVSEALVLEIKSDLNKNIQLDKVINHFPFRISQNSKYVSGILWI